MLKCYAESCYAYITMLTVVNLIVAAPNIEANLNSAEIWAALSYCISSSDYLQVARAIQHLSLSLSQKKQELVAI